MTVNVVFAPSRCGLAVCALLLGLASTRLHAQRIEVSVGIVPTIGPRFQALEDGRVASVTLQVSRRTRRMVVEAEALGLQGRTASFLSGDVAGGGARYRMAAALIGVRRSLGSRFVAPYVRVGAGLGVQTQQSGVRPVGRLGLGLAMPKWRVVAEMSGLATRCATEIRSAQACGYAPVHVGWRF